MDAITISAKFAAYSWYTETICGKYTSQHEAVRFAVENWKHFLGHADKGLGRLLIRLSKSRASRSGRTRSREAA